MAYDPADMINCLDSQKGLDMSAESMATGH
jgi:hypothetical protein